MIKYETVVLAKKLGYDDVFTLPNLQDWLRESHNVYIVIEPYKQKGHYKHYSVQWVDDKFEYIKTVDLEEINYHTLLEQQIQHCLNYLIDGK